MIPQTFYEWHQCITIKCGIQLTPTYIKQRLQVLGDDTHPETSRFKQLYGEKQLKLTVSWFKEVAQLMNN